MDSPSGRVPEQGPERFFVATEACGGGTPDLGLFLGVSIFIGFLASGTSQGVHKATTRQGTRPPPLWRPRGSFGPTLLLRGLLLVHKKSP